MSKHTTLKEGNDALSKDPKSVGVEALQNGGVQRLYTGNLPTGQHSLNVTYSGKLRNGKDFSRTDQFAFDKSIEPKTLGLKLAADAGASGIEFQDW